jgi:hypothetical protein
LKELVLTERSLMTYRNFGIEPQCRRCKKKFRVGDKIIKSRIRTENDENPFFCLEHFYAEKDDDEKT